MTVVKSRSPAQEGAEWPPADGVLVAAIGLALAGPGLPEAATDHNGDGAGAGFPAVPLKGAKTARCDHLVRGCKPTGDTEASVRTFRDCEQALSRARVHVEYTAEIHGECLIASCKARS